MSNRTGSRIAIAAALLGVGILCVGLTSHAFPGGMSFSASTFVSDSTHIRSSEKDGTLELTMQNGLVVAARVPSSGFFGLQQGDAISEMGGKPIASIDEVGQTLKAFRGEVLPVAVTRAGQKVHLDLPRKHGFDRLIE